jgi:hypothetical protein
MCDSIDRSVTAADDHGTVISYGGLNRLRGNGCNPGGVIDHEEFMRLTCRAQDLRHLLAGLRSLACA